jgi:serine/threonine-protein kinase
MITLRFVHGEDRVARTPLRRVSVDQEIPYETDARGELSVDLGEGVHWFKVALAQDDGAGWTYCVVKIAPGDALVTVQLDGRVPSRAMTNANVFSEAMGELAERFTFERVLGKGGVGIVIKAHDALLERPVAIKLLHDDLAHDPAVQRLFLREARGLARLSHPNLIHVHDVIVRDDRIVMITEYVRGVSLDVLLARKRRLEPRHVVKIGIQLARAIDYMHARGFLHRDLKPSNVMLQQDGSIRLIDFGLAARAEDITRHSRRAFGTPDYMAPEQLMGEELDARTDVYQLGVTLYELLSGSRPFPTPDLSQDVRTRHAQPLRAITPDADARLAALVHRCFQHARADRPQSADEVHAALQSLYVATSERERVGARRAALYVAAALAMLALAFAAGVAYQRVQPEPTAALPVDLSNYGIANE